MAYTSRKLGEICCDAPIDASPAAYRRAPVDQAKAAALLARLEMFKMMERWGVDPAAAHGDGGRRAPRRKRRGSRPRPMRAEADAPDLAQRVIKAGAADLAFGLDGNGDIAAVAAAPRLTGRCCFPAARRSNRCLPPV